MSAAPSIVQHVNNGGAGASVPIVGTLNNLYVLLAWDFAAMAAGATDSAGNTWTKLFGVADVNGNNIAVYVAPITHGGSTSVNAVSAGCLMEVVEVSGWSGSTADLKTFTVLVPSTTGAFTAAAPQQRVLSPSLVLMLAENQAGANTLTTKWGGVSATQLDSLAGLDASVCWQIAQSTVPALADPTISDNGSDDLAFGGIIIPNTDAPAAPAFGGGDADDRYRFRNSHFVSHTSTLGTIRAGWPDDAMDFGLQDTGSDNVARMN